MAMEGVAGYRRGEELRTASCSVAFPKGGKGLRGGISTKLIEKNKTRNIEMKHGLLERRKDMGHRRRAHPKKTKLTPKTVPE